MSILEETRMSLVEVAAFCQRDTQAVRRWIKDGLGGVKLEAIRVGRNVVTSREALNRFIAATNISAGK